jgi:hypothetical protein
MNWLRMVTLQFNQPKFQLSKMLRIIANEALEMQVMRTFYGSSNSSSRSTIIVAAANAATSPLPFKQTRPFRAPSRLSATASLHFATI